MTSSRCPKVRSPSSKPAHRNAHVDAWSAPPVICVPMPEGERFAIIRAETTIARTFPPQPGERWPDSVRRYVESMQLFTEERVRVELAASNTNEPVDVSSAA